MSRHPNLYELLKPAGPKPADDPPETASPPESPSLASPPKPGTGVFAAPETRHVTTRRATPAVKPSSLGERTFVVTYNSAAFAGLVVLGTVFLAYAIGIRIGRSRLDAAPPPPPTTVRAPVVAPEISPPVTLPPATYTIRLMEWAAGTNRDAAAGQSNASFLKNELHKRRLTDAQIHFVGEGSARRVVLTYGRFTDLRSSEAQEKLTALREMKLRPDREPLFKGAAFVRVD